MTFLERPNARVHYVVRQPKSPSGRWVTLLSGHGRSGKDFGTFTRVLVDRGFSVVTVDNRGAGESVASTDFTLEDIAEDVVAVWEREGIERSALLGISMGGMVAQTIALGPSAAKVTRLVLVSTTAKGRDITNASEVPGAPTAASPEERFGKYFSPTFVAKHRILFAAFLKEMARGFASEQAQLGSARQRAAIARFDTTTRLGHIGVPTLVIHGTDDTITPPAAAEQLARGIPKASLHWVRHAGHLLLAEQPRALYDAATEFFSRGLE